MSGSREPLCQRSVVITKMLNFNQVLRPSHQWLLGGPRTFTFLGRLAERRAVGHSMWGEEGWDVGDGSQQRGAGHWVLLWRQRDDDVVLIPHVESVGLRVVEHWGHECRAEAGHVLLFLVILSGAQHTIFKRDEEWSDRLTLKINWGNKCGLLWILLLVL